jgi:hypothetical protein
MQTRFTRCIGVRTAAKAITLVIAGLPVVAMRGFAPV